MAPFKGRSGKNNRAAIIACLILTAASLAVALHQTSYILRLERHGERAEAEVVDISRGARGSRKAVLEFTTADGKLIRTRDVFSMFVKRQSRGETVEVLYDPADPSKATVDLGRWIWATPGMLYFGSLFFGGLLILIVKAKKPAAE